MSAYIRALYAEGWTVREIAQALGWPRETTRRRLRAAGATLRPRGRRRLTESEVAAIRSELTRGAALSALAQRFGVSRQNIQQIRAGRIWRS